MQKVLRGLAIAAAMLAAPAYAQTTVYKGLDVNTTTASSIATNPNSDAANASFQSALSGVSTEGFEAFATNASSPLTLNFTGSAGTITAALTGSGSVENVSRSSPTSTGQYAVAGSKYFEIQAAAFNVAFSSPIAAFGFYAADLEGLSGINITLNLANGGGSEVYNLATVYGQNILESGSVNFLGFINTTQLINSVSFSGVGASSDVLAFDQLTVGDQAQVVNPPNAAVPEPAAWAMMIFGFGLVGGAMRRRQKAALRFA